MNIHTLLYAALLLPILVACSDNVKKLKEANPNAEDYSSALAAEYLSYGESERELGHSSVGDYFAGKGLDALAGKAVLPDDIKKDLNPADTQSLTSARRSLLALQTEDMKDVTPRKLARTQMLFDCWQRQLISHSNQELAPCADEFSSSLIELQDQADSFSTGKETHHMVSFAMKSAEVTSRGGKILDEIAERTKSYRRYGVQLDGHVEEFADGTVARGLALERMEAIRRALIVRGVADENIEVLRQKGRSHLAAVKLSSDKPRPQRSVTLTLRTYSAGEK
ncbi:MAG: hypothetical protein EBR02_04970 [Alphaproteobacteria bacterium]|nr:hypothetical protein [Alphaproteobacteria bacterium]